MIIFRSIFWLLGLNTSHRHTSETHVSISQDAERVSCIGPCFLLLSVTGQGASRVRRKERPPSSPSTSEFSSFLMCDELQDCSNYRKQQVKGACDLCIDKTCMKCGWRGSTSTPASLASSSRISRALLMGGTASLPTCWRESSLLIPGV